MTKAAIFPCPSPSGGNRERLFVVRCPRGVDPKGALDSAMRSMRRGGRDEMRYGRDDEERDADLHEKLREIIERHMDGDGALEALEALNEVFGGKVYGSEVDDEEREGPPDHDRMGERDREHMRQFLQDKNCSDEEIEEVLSHMPRNAREGGAGGRLARLEGRRADDRRARDRRPAMDGTTAEQRAEEMFGLSRIKQAMSFR
jgi:hypothetical protein